MLFVGLGNPGKNYVSTRHNLGFMILDSVVASFGFSKNFVTNSVVKYDLVNFPVGEVDCVFCKPYTFMNNSGSAVGYVARRYKFMPSQIVVIHDDIDLPIGKVKYKFGGSHGGHNGLKSIDHYIGKDYNRIRVGIGRPDDVTPVADFVLSPFDKQEQLLISEVIASITANISLICRGEIDQFKQYIAELVI